MIENVYLQYTEDNQIKHFRLVMPAAVIGRAPECDLTLPFSQVSRRHANISRQGDQYFLEDLNSANGSFINGTAVQKSLLKDGDEIRLGTFALTFHNSLAGRINLTDEYKTDANLTIAIPITRLKTSGIFALPQQERDPSKMIQVIFDASKTLIGFSTLDDVLAGVMDLVFEYLKADRGFLMLHDEAEGQLVPYVIKQRRAPARGDKNISFSRTIVNKVFLEGIAILTANAMQDERFSAQESIMMQQIRSCMCVPLWDEKKVIGIIYVDCMIFENYFQERDLDLLSTIAIISAIAIEQSRLNQEIDREKRIRDRLQRYHSPAVVNRIIGSGGESFMRTEEREVSILFADLVGFTSFTEKLEPSEVAFILNHFFSVQTDVIFQFEGTLDKYIGDALMALFGVPFSQPDHAIRAVQAAAGMFGKLEEINRSKALPVELQMRIAINSGKVVAGDIGSEKRMDYSVLGSTVNIASRLESSVAQPGDIVIGESTRNQIGDLYPLTCLGSVQLRGLSQPLTVFRVEYRKQP